MIKRIKICDFKSIREVDLKLDPVTVLVGRSGTGKSNLVQAIRFLRNVLLNQEKAIRYEWGWQRILPVGEKDPTPSIEVIFSIPGEEKEYNYRIAFGSEPRYGEPKIRAERLLLGGETVFSRSWSANGWRWDKDPEVVNIPHPVDGPMLGSFPSVQKIVLAYGALSTGIGYYHFPTTTLDPAIPPETRDKFLEALEGLWDNGANYRKVMRDITQDFHRPNLRKSLLATLQA